MEDANEESSNPILSYPILKRSGTPLLPIESAREGGGALLVESSAPPLRVVSSETLQHFLYFFPLPQWHGWLGLGFFAAILCPSLCLDRLCPWLTLQLSAIAHYRWVAWYKNVHCFCAWVPLGTSAQKAGRVFMYAILCRNSRIYRRA